tara:strand:- start:273 stop:539 length:267 start_codon:yes stop_codon:yes gene_type:complete
LKKKLKQGSDLMRWLAAGLTNGLVAPKKEKKGLMRDGIVRTREEREEEAGKTKERRVLTKEEKIDGKDKICLESKEGLIALGIKMMLV